MEVRVGRNDVGCGEEATDNWAEAVTDEIVAAPLGNFLAVKDVLALPVDGAATDACGEVGGRKDIKEQLALECDEKEIIGIILKNHLMCEAVITELEDKRKATFKYLDISGSEYCFANCTADRKAALMGVTATNDEAESALGSVTGNIQRYG
eukprot:scaffold178070_cov90-Cyclotella_meneghiniana.AAC.1